MLKLFFTPYPLLPMPKFHFIPCFIFLPLGCLVGAECFPVRACLPVIWEGHQVLLHKTNTGGEYHSCDVWNLSVFSCLWPWLLCDPMPSFPLELGSPEKTSGYPGKFEFQKNNKSFLFILLIYFWLCWAFTAMWAFSLVVSSQGYSSLQCPGFSLWWLLLLWSTGSRASGLQ